MATLAHFPNKNLKQLPMKIIRNLKISLIAGLIALPATLLQADVTPLSQGHFDLGLEFDNGELEWHVHAHSTGMELHPEDVLLQVLPTAQTLVPNDPRFSFLGTFGEPVWILPQVENPNLLALGIGAEEVETGIFVNDRLRVSLDAVQGPGQFFLYTVDGFGNPTVRMNTRDGTDPAFDFIEMQAGLHGDFNWAFTQPGVYHLTLTGSGTLVEGNEFLATDPTLFTFEVIPEPGTTALLILGAIGFAYFQWKRSGTTRRAQN
jgi:surface-anchored protein